MVDLNSTPNLAEKSILPVTALTQSGSNDTDLHTKPRRRKRNEDSWKKVRRSRDYNSGLKNRSGQSETRQIGPRCKCKRFQCAHITDDDRKIIYNTFWNKDASKITRQNYIVAHTERKPKLRAVITPQRNRGDTIKCFFTVGASRYNVCQEFFLNTLSISKQMVAYTLKHTRNGVRVQPSKRIAHNKTPDNVLQGVIGHINSFPKVESHYCRAQTKREYLESHLTVKLMHRLYKEANPTTCVKESYYRHIFNSMFNLGFHKPSNDRCDICDVYQKLKDPSDEERSSYERHRQRASQATDARPGSKSRFTRVLEYSSYLHSMTSCT